jgi:hypothetical protein
MSEYRKTVGVVNGLLLIAVFFATSAMVAVGAVAVFTAKTRLALYRLVNKRKLGGLWIS